MGRSRRECGQGYRHSCHRSTGIQIFVRHGVEYYLISWSTTVLRGKSCFLCLWAQQVDVVLQGRRTGDEQTFVKFDRALASGGVIGGTATGENKNKPRVGFAQQLEPIRTYVAFQPSTYEVLSGTDGAPRLFFISLVPCKVHFTCF